MTEEEINNYNKRCASFLGWTYVSSIDVKEGKYHTTIKAGWYTIVPKALALGLTQHLYKGRSHNSLKFHSDWNWIMEILTKIQSLPLDEHTHTIWNLKFRERKEDVVQIINDFLISYEKR